MVEIEKLRRYGANRVTTHIQSDGKSQPAQSPIDKDVINEPIP
jgi:hypothetical protein